MIVQCAACQARFKIADDKVVGSGVKVRCRKCSTVFVVRKDSTLPPDAPPLGRADVPSRPGIPALASAPPVAPGPRPMSSPSLVAAPGQKPPVATGTFRRGQAGAAVADPVAKAHRAAPAADPFANLDLGLGSTSSAPLSGADPFGRLDLSVPRAAAPVPAATQRPDPFSGLDVRPTARQAAARSASPPAPVASDDPFANIDLSPPPPGPVGGRASASNLPNRAIGNDPFAGIDVGLPSAHPPSAAHSADPFAGIEVGEAASRPPSASGGFDDLFAKALPRPSPTATRVSAPAEPSADPFAGIDLGAPARPASPPPPRIAPPAIPSVPSALDLGNIDLSPSSPDLPNFGDDAEASAPAPIPSPEMATEEPKTLVRNIRWAGGDADKVEVRSPAAVYAAQLLTRKAASKPSRNLVWSLVAALALLAAGAVVLDHTVRKIRERGDGSTPARLALAVHSLSSSYYPTRDRPLFLVHGKAENRSHERQGPAVKVTVELRRGESVERTAEAFVGRTPEPEALHALSGPLELSEYVRRLASEAGPLESGETRDFLAVFGEFPEDIADLQIHAIATTAISPPPSAVKTSPAPPATAPPQSPAREPEPALAEPLKPFPAVAPAEPSKPAPGVDRAAPSVAGHASKARGALPAKPKLEFPMHDPPRALRVKSGEPARTP
ncbi:MAG: zinc-ribbon domain-containing protein [Deltaproteobacteria bacterium]|nr:zinc-ribbon domain-containing protein [Deltaproteobacteria bacterium]